EQEPGGQGEAARRGRAPGARVRSARTALAGGRGAHSPERGASPRRGGARRRGVVSSGVMPRCPICKKAVRPRVENAGFPFCSSRCKLVDLGKWLNEEYRVPVEESPD